MNRTYKAEYADENFEIFSYYSNDEEAESYENEHGILLDSMKSMKNMRK